MKIKKTRSLKQVTFVFVAKKLTALSDIFLTFWGYAPDCSISRLGSLDVFSSSDISGCHLT